MPTVQPNANFYPLSRQSVHDNASPEYGEYRRRWMENPKIFKTENFPIGLDIEASSKCNIRCTFCDKLPLLSSGQFGDMDFSLYRRILNESEKFRLSAVKLSYRGEPLLNKNISRMVSYAKRRGVQDVYFNTNGMLLTEDNSRSLIRAGLDRISISIEGTDAESFEKERRGARLNTIIGNIEFILKLRKNRNLNKPRIRIQTIFTGQEDMEGYKIRWGPYCDEVAAVDYKDSKNRKKGIIFDWACPQLWQRLTVDWQGNVSPCNNDDFRLLCVGNARDKSMHECWLDKKAQDARTLHRLGRSHEVEACDGCPWRTAQINKLSGK